MTSELVFRPVSRANDLDERQRAEVCPGYSSDEVLRWEQESRTTNLKFERAGESQGDRVKMQTLIQQVRFCISKEVLGDGRSMDRTLNTKVLDLSGADKFHPEGRPARSGGLGRTLTPVCTQRKASSV